MKIIACLGNPGTGYRRNRHNIGFIIGEHLADALGIRIDRKAFSSKCGAKSESGEEMLILFPQTFMNHSGVAVGEALRYYRSDPGNLIVVHDEIELPFGEVRLKFGGGHKGHNGLRSIMQHLDTGDFHRIRFGVGRPDNPHLSVADYVLSDFSADEMEKITGLLPIVQNMISDVLSEGSV
jgi:peptidyl-tRNA hydrolase, PTH1 family